MPANASSIETIWTISALIGFAVNLWALFDALYDLHALHLAGLNGARRIVALGNVRREVFRIFAQVCFLVIGVTAMSTPPDHDHRRVSLFGVIFTVCFVAAAVSLVLSAAFDRLERLKLIAYITEHYDGGGC